jgi:hypothetical protein
MRAVIVVGWLNVIAWATLAGIILGIALFGPPRV